MLLTCHSSNQSPLPLNPACPGLCVVKRTVTHRGNGSPKGVTMKENKTDKRFKHGCSGSRTGTRRTGEYESWAGIIKRCLDVNSPRFVDYGARGITICARWRNSFENFIADMGLKPTPQHSIDRINNDGNYEPGNCRWATPSQQNRNKGNNRRITLNGQTKLLAEWSELTGISASLILKRIKAGWSIEKTLSVKPISTRKTFLQRNNVNINDAQPQLL